MKKTSIAIGLLAAGGMTANAALVWTLGNSDVAGRQAPEIREFYGDTGNVTFWQENNQAGDALPGSATSGTGNQNQDDDYYFAGIYSTQVDGGPAYVPLGVVAAHEENLERAVTNGDPRNRFHFNFDASHAPTDIFTVSFAMLDLNDNNTGTGQYDFAINVNGVNVGNVSHTQGTIGTMFTSNGFTLGDVGATAGAPEDNYVELIADGGGSSARWSNFDYIRMDVEPIPEPGAIGFLALAAAGLTFLRRRR